MNIINSFNMPGLLGPVELNQLQVGQRVPVEIIRTDGAQEGLISLGGTLIKAKLEAQVQQGDRFWAAVRETGENGLILARENLSSNSSGLSPKQVLLLLNRGLGFDPEIASFLEHFTGSINTGLASLLASRNPYLSKLIHFLWEHMPEWSGLSAKNYSPLGKYYIHLGLEHERLIYELLKNPNREEKIAEGQTVKEQVLVLLKESTGILSRRDRDCLENLLAEIVGQQLWIQKGVRNNVYFLMYFPLKDQDNLYNCRIAVESSRKGSKMDMDHCHIALQVDTENLGTVGADIRLYENKIYLCILHNDIEVLAPLIDIAKNNVREAFAELGLMLQDIALKKFADFPQHEKFISGDYVGGVDIKG